MTKHIADHTAARRAWKNSITNISTDHSAGLNSNHRLVVTKLTVKRGKVRGKNSTQKFNRKPTAEETEQYHMELNVNWANANAMQGEGLKLGG